MNATAPLALPSVFKRLDIAEVVVVTTPDHEKVPVWEQEASAAGVAHVLSLLLDEAGWGVMWRTGPFTRHPLVAEAHGLAAHEHLLGWLYVGGLPHARRGDRRSHGIAASRLTVLD